MLGMAFGAGAAVALLVAFLHDHRPSAPPPARHHDWRPPSEPPRIGTDHETAASVAEAARSQLRGGRR